MTSWWLNQPIWKTLYSQNGNLPQVGVRIKLFETTTWIIMLLSGDVCCLDERNPANFVVAMILIGTPKILRNQFLIFSSLFLTASGSMDWSRVTSPTVWSTCSANLRPMWQRHAWLGLRHRVAHVCEALAPIAPTTTLALTCPLMDLPLWRPWTPNIVFSLFGVRGFFGLNWCRHWLRLWS